MVTDGENDFSLRDMEPEDMADVCRISKSCYSPELAESLEALKGKYALGRGTCVIVEIRGEIAGYIIAYPAAQWHIGKLDAVSEPGEPECLYLHDIAVDSRWRGMGLANRMYGTVEEKARALGLKSMALVSVQGSRGIYEKWGFHCVEPHSEYLAAFNTYGDDAFYMIRELD